jgi:hypothetical protein
LSTELTVIPVDELSTRQTALARIETSEQAQDAGLLLREVRTAIRVIKAKYLAIRKPVNDALKDIKKQEERDLRPYEQAELHVNAPLIAWQIRDRERVENERKAALERAKAEEQASRAAAVAELDAAAAAAKGTHKTIFKAQAKALRTAPLVPRVTEPMAEATKIKGVTLREYWYAEVTDLAMLVQAVAAGRAPLSCLQANQEFLDEQADSLRKELSYPGVTATYRHGQRARAV